MRRSDLIGTRAASAVGCGAGRSGRIANVMRVVTAAIPNPTMNRKPVGGSVAAPPAQPTIGSDRLADGARHHVVAEHPVEAARPAGPHAQHLLRRHQEQVSDAEQGGKRQQRGGGGKEGEAPARQREQARADPDGVCVVAAIDVAADPHGDADREQRERRRITPSQTTDSSSSTAR